MAPWGPFAPGDELALPNLSGRLAPSGGLDDLILRGVRIECGDAQVIAVRHDGEPVLVSAPRGAGHVVTCALPIELLLAAVPDGHGPRDGSWGLYAGLADLSGARDEARVDHPELTCGSLRGHVGGTLVVTNHSPAPVRAPLRLPAGAHDAAARGA